MLDMEQFIMNSNSVITNSYNSSTITIYGGS